MQNEYKYFDMQVNGYAGVDFNDEKLTLDRLRFACVKLEKDNVEGILATLITDDFVLMKKRIEKIVRYANEDPLINKIIYGLHIEGPFINREEGYRGAHPKKYIRSANEKEMSEIIDSGNGFIKLVTLAPEVDKDFLVTKMLKNNGVIVSAGHSNASLETLKGAVDNGLSMFTHLGNGCPGLIKRHDNIIERVLSLSEDLWISFIADGHHIKLFALRNYLKSVGFEKCIVVTDAMAAASAPRGTYKVGSICVEVGKDKIVRQPGRNNLAGSAITMRESAHNLSTGIGLSKDVVKMLTSINPRKALNIL